MLTNEALQKLCVRMCVVMGVLKIKLAKVKTEGKGEKWRKSSTVLLIDSPLPISQD